MKRISSLALGCAGLIAMTVLATAQSADQAKGVDAPLLRQALVAKSAAESSAVFVEALEGFVRARTEAVQAAMTAATAAEEALAKAKAELAVAQKALAETDKERLEAYKSAEKRLAAAAAALKEATAKTASTKAAVDLCRAAKNAAMGHLASRVSALQATFNKAAEAEATALGGLKPLPAGAWDFAKARHLLTRAGFGGTPDEVAKLHAMGLHLAVDYLVNYQQTPGMNLPFDAVLPARPGPEEKAATPQERQLKEARRRGEDNQQINRLRQWWLQRLLQSPRPLQEKLALFWHGHFATQQSIVQNSYAMYKQNELFREHAADNFAALLHGIIHDPAMLRYLDNNTNVKGKPNENLARETMELFSMGEGRGYTEKDIMEAARALTGYTFDPLACQFRFLASQHDPAPKTIFGQTGNWNGEDFVDLILRQPAASRFLAGKLFAFFAHEKPSPEVVERLASVLRNCDYQIAPMLRNLFLSEEFYSPKAMGTLIKSPVQLVVGMYRELGYKDINALNLEFSLRSMGQDLFEPPNVKGWEGGRNWINANVLITRYNTINTLLSSQLFTPGQPFGRNQPPRFLDLAKLFQGQDLPTPGAVVDHLVKCHLAVPLAAEKRQELIAYLGDLPPSSRWSERPDVINAKLRGLLVLMFSTPEYQMT